MTDEPGLHDFSRLDAHMASVRRTALPHAMWKPALAGAIGAALVIAAVAIAQPRFTTREVIVDHVVQKDVSVDHVVPRDVTVDHVIPHDVEIAVPRVIEPQSLARTPAEERFVGSAGWKGAVVRGRILRAEANGFVTMTDQGEVGFYPAKIGPGGKIEPDPSVRDVVDSFIGALARCNQLPIGTYRCVALGQDGRESVIAQAPIGAPL